MLRRLEGILVDIVGADRAPIARELRFVGSIKWLEGPFDDHDLHRLIRHRAALTDRALPLVAVSRSGVACSGAAAYGPEELVRAWR
ncbi:hypothetical protein [Microtetraspora malaysiensis]|uniref:Uncharacterized protein n=1 Tax=Microtetraspora malaysiensis TaxID=161358 RepID=A0ABW6SYM6_9ACTN